MTDPETQEGTFGIRVSLPAGDPFANLLEENWQTTHWYEARGVRDMALADMQREHEYSRAGDTPSLIFKPVERTATPS